MWEFGSVQQTKLKSMSYVEIMRINIDATQELLINRCE